MRPWPRQLLPCVLDPQHPYSCAITYPRNQRLTTLPFMCSTYRILITCRCLWVLIDIRRVPLIFSQMMGTRADSTSGGQCYCENYDFSRRHLLLCNVGSLVKRLTMCIILHTSECRTSLIFAINVHAENPPSMFPRCTNVFSVFPISQTSNPADHCSRSDLSDRNSTP